MVFTPQAPTSRSGKWTAVQLRKYVCRNVGPAERMAEKNKDPAGRLLVDVHTEYCT